jgi:hypothetical protein
MVDSINVTGLSVAGRIDAPDPKNGQVAIQKNLDFSNPTSASIDFNSVNQQQTIGVIRTLFCDNTSNPSEIVVQALGTGQNFTVPAYAEGYFPIISRLNAGIVLTTDGGATKPVGVTFFNYDIAPVVWYKYGASNKDVAQAVRGALPENTATGGNVDARPFLIAGKSPTGTVKTVNVDANGALMIANLAVTIGAVYGPDAVGAAPAFAPLTIGAIDSAGKVQRLNLTAANELYVADLQGRTSLSSILAQITTAVTRLTSILAFTQGGAASTITSFAGTTVNTTILVPNANRKGAIIFNDSTSAMRLAFGLVDSTVDYSVLVQPGDSYALNASDYTGAVRCSWITANGFARITEIS